MRLTNFKGNPPARTAGSAARDVAGESFNKKLGALRSALGRPERLVSRCACAIHDKLFSVVYERTDAARPFTIAGTFKVDEDDCKGSMSGAARSRAVAASEVDMTGWRCVYCADDRHIVACGQCGATVCGGRTRAYPGTGEIFECRKSCGARGTLEPLETVNGVEPTRAAITQKLSVRLPQPDVQMLRLGGPKAPRLK